VRRKAKERGKAEVLNRVSVTKERKEEKKMQEDVKKKQWQDNERL